MEYGDCVFSNLNGEHKVSLEDAKRRGDFVDLASFLTRGRQDIIEAVKSSGLRGRGGAGFPTGLKWSFMPKENLKKPSYFIINADESEPGTCKDRNIIRYEPYKIIEGCVIASYAMSVELAFIYIRGEFYHEASVLQKAIEEAYQDGLLGQNIRGTGFSLDIVLHRGAGAYICGEESALIESLSGNKGMPRLKPPFPAGVGLYGCPTTVNNVETVAVVPTILRRGSAWFSSLGVPESAGTKVFCISGHVHKPCVVEAPMGIPIRTLIETYAGGVEGGWDNLLAVIPGGSSVPLLTKEIAEKASMDYTALKNVGSALGTGGLIVMNKQTDIVQAMLRIAHFYMHESCGQCTPCREGTGWVYRLLKSIADSKAKKGAVDELLTVASSIEGNTICALGDAAAWPIQGLVRHFRAELEARLQP